MRESSVPSLTSSLADWLQYLQFLHHQKIDLGLERVATVAEKGELTSPALKKVITVAGTNGKGSTCAIIEQVLINAGYRVGVYSSPHLVHYNERVRIQGALCEDAKHVEAFAAIEALRGDVSLSFFEFGTLAALWLLKQSALDVVILEVGLGGRLDATNVVDHDISVITSLGLDHTDWLGDDLDQIAFEKAGIFRADKPAVCGQPNPPATVAAVADEIGAKLYQVGYQYRYQKQTDDLWEWKMGAFGLEDLPIPALPLQNAATALMTLGLAELDVSDEDIEKALLETKLSGRMEKVSENPLVILDVAHNPDSGQYLASQLARLKSQRGGQIHAVVGMLGDKDIFGTLQTLENVVDVWYPATLSDERGSAAVYLNQYLEASVCFDDPVSAYQAAMTHLDHTQDLLVVFGSFHTVGQVTEYLNTRE